MAMGGIGEAMLLNAAIGGTVSAVAGGDPLKGALLGGLTGGIMGGLGGGAAAAGTNAATQTATQAGTAAAAATPSATGLQALLGGAQAPGIALNNPSAFIAGSGADATAALQGLAQGAVPDYVSGTMVAPVAPIPPGIDAAAATGVSASPTMATTPAGGDRGLLGGMVDKFKALPFEKQLLYGGMGGLGLMSLMNRPEVPGAQEYDGPLKRFRYNPARYSAGFAGGGIADVAPIAMTRGGISDLGSYSDGGRMLRGPGDGMSDNIPGVIGGKRPARLADGEFVVPADVVSHLGNGSTDAGAKQLYAMMDRVRAARTGTKKQGRQINPMRAMPA